ncbi:MAG: hypothetical protein EP330_05755 [Deltaproteobacteria bacterium]|nr:MAG: hypothetical protein EP330_05755 [Deltaproteobacteria bacterium]
MAPRVLYVMGTGRSGSTVLGALLGAAPDAVFAGELTWAPAEVFGEHRPCSCGELASECSLWAEVEARLGWSDARRRAAEARFQRFDWHKGFAHQLVASAAEWAAYERDNRELIDAIGEVSGAQWVVDSSKYPARAVALSRVMPDRVSVVSLTRSPEGLLQAFSRQNEVEQRPKKPLAVLPWYGANAAQIVWARGRVDLKAELRYEAFHADPCAHLARLGEATGLDLDAVIAAVGSGDEVSVGHVVTGNRLRKRGEFVFQAGPDVRPTVTGRRARASALGMRVLGRVTGI